MISTELPGVPCVMMQKELVFIEPVRIGDTITAEVEVIDVNHRTKLDYRKSPLHE